MTRPPLDILREVAERLGYLSVLHGCPPPSADGHEIVAAVDFHGGQHGGQSGTISIGCGPGIGAALAANMLATSKPDFETAREAVLELANVVPLQARVETLNPDIPFSTVISRAYAALPDLLGSVRGLCGADTRVVALKGRYPQDELSELPRGWRLAQVRKLTIPGLDAERHSLSFVPQPA